MRELVQVLKAIADKNRIRIIKMLEKKKMCVCELSAVLEITQPSVSKHLSILNHAGIIKGERNGTKRPVGRLFSLHRKNK